MANFIKMKCLNCGHEWAMDKKTYLFTPYNQRGINTLFCCVKCGSQGKKIK